MLLFVIHFCSKNIWQAIQHLRQTALPHWLISSISSSVAQCLQKDIMTCLTTCTSLSSSTINSWAISLIRFNTSEANRGKLVFLSETPRGHQTVIKMTLAGFSKKIFLRPSGKTICADFCLSN